MCNCCRGQLDITIYIVSPLNGAKVVCPDPHQLLVTVPVSEGNLSEELAIGTIR